MNTGLQAYHNQQSAVHHAVHKSSLIHLNASSATAITWLRWLILVALIALIIIGIIKLFTQINNPDEATAGLQLIKAGITFMLLLILTGATISLALTWGIMKGLIILAGTGIICTVLIQFPRQLYNAISMAVFREWFNDSDVERDMVNAFTQLHVLPLIFIIVTGGILFIFCVIHLISVL
ncbi:hypothetical protein ACI3E1_07390 [Ligilactobacillus sp. LYQ139]|uniref:hypothetical protein n=1 Tax=Ligilactobacillus sp. LYQ139 TaxID=3378800 RepID=UPI003853B91F